MCRTQDQILSERIFQKVQQQNLMSNEDFERFKTRLNDKSLTKEDINLYIENKVETELNPPVNEVDNE